ARRPPVPAPAARAPPTPRAPACPAGRPPVPAPPPRAASPRPAARTPGPHAAAPDLLPPPTDPAAPARPGASARPTSGGPPDGRQNPRPAPSWPRVDRGRRLRPAARRGAAAWLLRPRGAGGDRDRRGGDQRALQGGAARAAAPRDGRRLRVLPATAAPWTVP